MKRLTMAFGFVAALGFGSLGIAGCSTTSGDDPASESPSAASPTATSQSASPSPSTASSSATRSPAPTTNVSATGIAESLTCSDIVSATPPAAAKPKPTSTVRCSLGDQGYVVYAYSTQAAASTGLAQLASQAGDTGETLILATGNTWTVIPAEGTTVGKDMLKAAKAVGGKKTTLP